MAAGPTHIVGWRERVDFPSLELFDLRCKIDTGAKSSALHAENIRPFRRKGQKWVRCEVYGSDRKARAVELRLVEMRWVKSSNGSREHRPLVRLDLSLGSVSWTAEVTLTTRDGMEFPLLLGRESLRGRFLIDPERSYLQKPPSKKKVSKKKSSKKAVKKKAAKKKAVKKKAAKKKAVKKKAS